MAEGASLYLKHNTLVGIHIATVCRCQMLPQLLLRMSTRSR